MDSNRIAIVNAEYEFQLYEAVLNRDIEVPKKRSRAALEFLYFFINHDPGNSLYSKFEYSPDYLNYLRELEVFVPEIISTINSKKSDTFNWYGTLDDIEVEKDLNSKIWMYQFLEDIGMNQEVFLVNSLRSIQDIAETSNHQSFILKDPYLMSGLNMSVFEKNAIPELDLKYTYILEPYLKRIVDLAYFYNPFERKGRFYINQTTYEGSYVGAIIFKNEDDLISYIKSLDVLEQFREIEKKTKEIIKNLHMRFDLKQLISLDSFIYEQDGLKVAYPLCDINYRVNMGALVNSLVKFCPDNGVGQFILTSNRLKSMSSRKIRYESTSKKGIIYLSPENSHALGVFICSDSISDLAKVRKKFQITLKK